MSYQVDVVLMSLMRRQLVELNDPAAVIPEYCLVNHRKEESNSGFSGFESPRLQEASKPQFAGWSPLSESSMGVEKLSEAFAPISCCDENAEEIERPSSPVFGLVENHKPLQRYVR